MPHHHAYHPTTGFKDDSEVFVYLINSVSLLGSLAILLTIAVFPDFYRRQLYVKILTCLALADLIRAIAGLFGYPTYRDLCYAQGVLWTASIYAGIGWTTLLSFTVYNQIRYGKIYIKYWPWMHVIVWPSSILLAFGPLMSGNLEYGPLSDGGDACVLRTVDSIDDDHNRKEELQTRELLTWIFVGKIGIYFSCLLIMTLLPLVLKCSFIPKLKDTKGVIFASRTEQLVDTVLLYPLGMVIAWLPAMVVVIVLVALHMSPHSEQEHNTSLDAFFVTYLWGSVYGAYTGVVFIANSSEVRIRWMKFFKKYVICETLQDDAMIGLEEELADMSQSERLMVDDDTVAEDLEALKSVHEHELRNSEWSSARRLTKRLTRRFTQGLDQLNKELGLSAKDGNGNDDDDGGNDNVGGKSTSSSIQGIFSDVSSIDGSNEDIKRTSDGVEMSVSDANSPQVSTNEGNTNPIHSAV